MDKLSVAIITLNEEKNIGRCLDSVKDIADEIVIVDSFSTDKTKEICHAYSAHFSTHPFEGYIQQKNHALTLCNFRYVLSLDADEALSPALRESIRHEKTLGFKNGYTMSRLTNYCGKWIKHCGWYPDTKLRLFDKNSGSWGGANPHDKFILHSRDFISSHLKGDLLHYSYYTIAEHYRQADRFASIAAKAMYENGKKSSVPHAALKATAKFTRNYFLKLGFLDGASGLTICKISALETWWKYRRLNQLKTGRR